MSAPRGVYAAFALAAALAAAPPAVGGVADVEWNGWTFDFEVASDITGLSLSNVEFQLHPVIAKLSFPVMRVFYANNACGPYADRLGGTIYPIPWANNATIAQREFTLNGRQWYEIGIRDVIGAYDMYQVYYLSADGIIDAHIYSTNLECVVNHIHYPNWRIDFELDGDANDQILRDPGAGMAVLPTEFTAAATTAANHAWRVQDAVTGLYVDVLPGFADFSIPDGLPHVPITGYSNHTVFGRRYRASEDTGWTYGPNTQVPFNNGEDIDGEDLVLWYEGYMPHLASEGDDLWHSTGVRLVINLPVDTDADGVLDATDNCTMVANASQCDSNADGYGNRCDGDLDNDGVTNAQDYALFRSLLGTVNADADLNCNGGKVNVQDYSIFRFLLGSSPGPSGLVPP